MQSRFVLAAALAATLISTSALSAEMKDVGSVRLGSVLVPQPSASDRDTSRVDAAVGAAVAQAMGFGEGTALRLLKTTRLPKDRGRALRYAQTYRGLPIAEQQVVVRQLSDGTLLDASGTAVFDIAARRVPGPTPRLDADAALQIGIDSVVPKGRKQTSAIENPTSELVYRLGDDGNLQLVYQVSFFTTVHEAKGHRPTRPVLFVDANTGRIVFSYENLQHIDPENLINSKHRGTGPGGNEGGAGRYKWGNKILPKFLITKVGDECLMDADSYLQTEDLKNTTVATDEPYSYKCFNNVGIAVNGGYSPMNDAQAMGEVVFDLYTKWYGVRPLGSRKLLLRVRYAEPTGDIDNAFWNGVAMTFGNGKEWAYPLVSLSVTGHEVSHGFTELNSGLLYFGEAGGINEAFSDMAGVATEAYFADVYGQPYEHRIPDFTIGREIKKDNKPLRYLCNPTRDGRSIDNARDVYPDIDPHQASGVFNKAFCLLAKSPGWDIQRALGVFLIANESYWVPRTTYRSGARDVMRAAELAGLPTDRIGDAFAAVGIDLPVLKVGAPTDKFVGKAGGPFSPNKVRIKLSSKVPVRWVVSGVPNWLSISETSGIVRGSTSLQLRLKPSASKLKKSRKAVLTFYNDSEPGQTPIRKTVRLTVKPPKNTQSPEAAVLEIE